MVSLSRSWQDLSNASKEVSKDLDRGTMSSNTGMTHSCFFKTNFHVFITNLHAFFIDTHIFASNVAEFKQAELFCVTTSMGHFTCAGSSATVDTV